MESKICFGTGEIFKHHDTGRDHPENPRRIEVLLNFLKHFKHIDIIEFVEPERTHRRTVELIHDPEYVEYIKVLSDAGGGHPLGDLDTVISKRTYEVALYAAGTALKVLTNTLIKDFKMGFAAIRPPGHHAHRNIAKGFCIFNNVAIMAQYLIENYDYKRILIFDIDAHHGDGTQEIFYDTDRVLYVSLHQDPRTLYPGTGFPEEVGEREGEGFNINIPLPPSTSDTGYMLAIKKLAKPIIEQYKPEIALVSAGFDTHHKDPLTDISLTLKSYWEIGRFLLNLGKIKNIVAVLEGGYSLEVLPKAIFNFTLASYFNKPLFQEKVLIAEKPDQVRKYIEKAIAIYKKYWEL